jgi:pectate lyase
LSRHRAAARITIAAVFLGTIVGMSQLPAGGAEERPSSVIGLLGHKGVNAGTARLDAWLRSGVGDTLTTRDTVLQATAAPANDERTGAAADGAEVNESPNPTMPGLVDRPGGPGVPLAPPVAPPAAPTVAPTQVPTVAPAAAPTVAPTPPPVLPTSVSSPLAVVGYGAGTTGGMGGQVYAVSTWAQLKAALLASRPRIVRLTGSANLDGGGEHVKIENGNLTIDGSAWSGGLRRYSLVIAASNVIVTQLRLRPGDQIDRPAEGDGLTINPGNGSSLSKVVIDHSSLLWATDVTLGILNNSWDVTVQYSILGAGLYYSTHPEVTATHGHSMGPNVTTVGSNPNPGSEYGRRITFYRNYIVHNNGRNIRAQGSDGIEYVNNVVYNWGTDLAHMNPRGANVVGNMFKPGPNTPATSQVLRSDTNDSYPTLFADSVYWADNLGLGFTPTLALDAGVQRSSLYGGGLHYVSATPASSALAASVVAGAGPSLVDTVDQRLKNDFSTGGGSFYNGAGYPAPNPTWQ